MSYGPQPRTVCAECVLKSEKLMLWVELRLAIELVYRSVDYRFNGELCLAGNGKLSNNYIVTVATAVSIIHHGGRRERFWRTWEEKSVYGKVNQALKIAKVITAYAWLLKAHVRGLIPCLTRTASKSINRNASSNEHENLKEKFLLRPTREFYDQTKSRSCWREIGIGQHQHALLKFAIIVLLREKRLRNVNYHGEASKN